MSASTAEECHVLWSSPLRLYLKGVTVEVKEVSSEGTFRVFLILLLLLLGI